MAGYCWVKDYYDSWGLHLCCAEFGLLKIILYLPFYDFNTEMVQESFLTEVTIYQVITKASADIFVVRP